MLCNLFSGVTLGMSVVDTFFFSLVPTCPKNRKNQGFLDTGILTTIANLRTARFTLNRKNRQRLGCLGQYLQSRNDSDPSDHIVKIADRLGFLG